MVQVPLVFNQWNLYIEAFQMFIYITSLVAFVMHMQDKTTAFLAIAIIALAAALVMAVGFQKPSVVNVSGNGPDLRDTITVTGNADLSVQPDQAEIYLSITTESANAKDAQDKNRETSNKVIDTLKNSGVKGVDIETSGYNLGKKTRWDETQKRYVDDGYSLVHTLKVTTTNLEGSGKIVDAAVLAGANGVESVSFGLTKESQKKLQTQALMKATEDARSEAQSIASSLGVSLGKVTSVQETNFYYTPYKYDLVALSAGGADAPAPTTISPQKVDVTSRVDAVYLIG